MKALLEAISDRPRAACRPASVTMKAWMRNLVEIAPWTAPNTTPVTMTSGSVVHRLQPSLTSSVAVSTEQRPSTAPTERSMPAAMITKVMPSARMPVSEIERMMLAMLSGPMNRMWPCRRGEKIRPAMITRIRPSRLWKRTR